MIDALRVKPCKLSTLPLSQCTLFVHFRVSRLVLPYQFYSKNGTNRPKITEQTESPGCSKEKSVYL